MAHTYSSILGYKLVESEKLVKDGPLIEVKRSFFDRLFSLTPFVKTKMVPSKVPMETILKTGDTLVMHPIVAKKLRFYLRCNKYSLVRLYLLKNLKEKK